MPGLDKIVSAINDDKEVQRDLGYLTRAVEDLTSKLEAHMNKEERDRVRAVQEFSEYRSKTDSKLVGLDRKIDNVSNQTKGIKLYILLITAVAGTIGLVFDNVDTESLKSIWRIISVFLG